MENTTLQTDSLLNRGGTCKNNKVETNWRAYGSCTIWPYGVPGFPRALLRIAVFDNIGAQWGVTLWAIWTPQDTRVPSYASRYLTILELNGGSPYGPYDRSTFDATLNSRPQKGG